MLQNNLPYMQLEKKKILYPQQILEDVCSPYSEVLELSGIFLPFYMHFHYSSCWRSPFTEFNKFFHIFSFPLKDCFHSTVNCVSNPALQISFCCFVQGFHTEKDALNPTTYQDVGSNFHVCHLNIVD